MSKKREKTSSVELDRQENGSVYDFLYQDARRIGSFLAQFERFGHLQSLTETKSASEEEGSSYDSSGTLGVPSIAGVAAAGHQHATSSHAHTASKTYDPLWQNSLALLDYLEQRSLICRNLARTHVGQFSLVSGKLTIYDMALMKALMLTKRMSRHLAKVLSDADGTVAVPHKQAAAEKHEYLQAAQAIIKELPFGVHLHLRGQGFGIWASLRAENLELNTEDLSLKHGAVIAGEWNMLGILDAMPDNPDEIPDFSYFKEGELGKHVAELATNMRPKLGRPATSYGVTPLLIFREIPASIPIGPDLSIPRGAGLG